MKGYDTIPILASFTVFKVELGGGGGGGEGGDVEGGGGGGRKMSRFSPALPF